MGDDMAIVNEYRCMDCGIELVDDGRAFVWDSESNRTRDFLILMGTHHWLYGAKISGDVDETYCRVCDKFLKVYSITEVAEGIGNPIDIVMEGIRNHIDDEARKLEKLKDIKRRAEYTITRKENYYVVKVPEWEDFFYSNYLFPQMTREEVIEDALNDFHKEIGGLIEVREKEYQKFLNSNILVVEDSKLNPFDERDLSKKVNCPVCGSEVHKYVDSKIPCPKCGGRICCVNITCYD